MRLSSIVLLNMAALCVSAAAVAQPPATAADAQRASPRGGPQAAAPPTEADKREAANAAQWNAKPSPADPRDLQGVWQIRRAYTGFRPLTTALVDPAQAEKFFSQRTPAEVAFQEHNAAMVKAGTPEVDTSGDCLPHGAPRIMSSNYPIQIDFGPDVIVFLHEVTHDLRFIHMDGKPAPADEPVTYMGYSRGHWDGNTLVVDTDHFNTRTVLEQTRLTHGPRMKLREAFTKFTNRYGGTELRELITIDDPDYFTSPLVTEKIFSWRGDLPISEYTCEENNRNKSVEGVTVAR